ncbi:Transmembrane domain-containing protein [Giardia muris]|uniref:Transmembrane domain-containing protein n=1 Tax=Giardia muris TaxID=5742 RepID=A0A4Z1SX29_GIAMU|nr:Transmembrane domain-containing protein [Giardia muris]|eukprot:TNJ30100.1 Transmembrane domain-containing protein [Giardia muris]
MVTIDRRLLILSLQLLRHLTLDVGLQMVWYLPRKAQIRSGHALLHALVVSSFTAPIYLLLLQRPLTSKLLLRIVGAQALELVTHTIIDVSKSLYRLSHKDKLKKPFNNLRLQAVDQSLHMLIIILGWRLVCVSLSDEKEQNA